MAEMRWNGPAREKDVAVAMRRNVAAAGIYLQGRIKTTLNAQSTGRDQPTQSSPGSPPGKRTGTLSRSIQVDTTNLMTDPTFPRVRVGTNLVYARIHEFGGEIHAVEAKALTVPLNNEARALRRQHASLREIPGLMVWPHTNILGRFIKRGKKSIWQALFALKQFVRMPMRPYMRPTYDAERQTMQQIISGRRLA